MKLGRLFRKMGLPAWTFIGIGISAIWFNTVSGLLERVLGDAFHIDAHTTGLVKYLPDVLVICLPFLFVLVVGSWQSSQYSLTRLLFHGSEMRQPGGKRILILLVSNPASAEFAIRYHWEQKRTLHQICLIHSNDAVSDFFGSSSQRAAEDIEKLVNDLGTSLGRKPLDVKIMPGVSPADAQDTFERVNRIYREAGCSPREIIADFTGGTKPMTTGMIMACLPAERELEYVAYNPATKQMHGPFLIDYQHSAFDLIG